MFDNNKGKTAKIVNGVLLLITIGIVISLLVSLITNLLPEGGDYSKFVLNDFIMVTLELLISSGIYIGALYLINNKINLFDKTYPFTKKLINIAVLTGILACLEYSCVYVIESIFGDIGNFEKEILAVIAFAGTDYYLANKTGIFSVSNGKSKNIMNFISVSVIAGAVFRATLTIMDISTFKSIVDFIRTILIEGIVVTVFGVALYFINRKKEN